MHNPEAPQYYSADFDQQVHEFIDQHRDILAACLDGLTEEEARARFVPSKTTLLGLVKHAAFVERVWFSEAPTGLSRAELGIVATPDESFELSEEDTIAFREGDLLCDAESVPEHPGLRIDVGVHVQFRRRRASARARPSSAVISPATNRRVSAFVSSLSSSPSIRRLCSDSRAAHAR